MVIRQCLAVSRCHQMQQPHLRYVLRCKQDFCQGQGNDFVTLVSVCDTLIMYGSLMIIIIRRRIILINTVKLR